MTTSTANSTYRITGREHDEQIAALTRQRDELAAALRDVMLYVGSGESLWRNEDVRLGRDLANANNEYNYQVQQAIAHARAALAELEPAKDGDDFAADGVQVHVSHELTAPLTPYHEAKQ